MVLSGSIIDVIRSRASAQPDDPAFSFVAHGPSGLVRTDRLTYAEIDATAARIATTLARTGAPGDRVLLACPPGSHFVIAFVACLYAGLIPAPTPLPAGSRAQQSRVTGILASSGARIALTDDANLPALQEWLSGVAPQVAVLSTQGSARSTRGSAPVTVDLAEDIAFLQYTSGSTSEPRGVVVTHASAMANLSLIQSGYGFQEGTRIGGWLPPYHDMGLMGTILMPFYTGGEGVLMDPGTFLRRPGLWLEMIDKFGLQVSPAPNFAYELVVRRVPADQVAELDLSRWRWAINGAEPVHAGTLERFATHLAPSGFRPEALCPSYGMAETALFVSGSPPNRVPLTTWVDTEQLQKGQFTVAEPGEGARLLVGSGPVEGYCLQIADPDSGHPLGPGEIGEIWLHGPSVGRGYWNDAEQSALVFEARMPDGQETFLRTGDLGVEHEGEIFVTGRIKELLILNGRNVYPQDVEREVRELSPACADGVGAAFCVSVGETERLVLVHEARLPGAEPSALRALARTVMVSLSARLGVPVGNIVLVRPGRILRSTSGKVQRVAMKALFESGELSPLIEELDDGVRRTFRAGRP